MAPTPPTGAGKAARGGFSIGDVFGRLAAMLVALPSAIAFGLLVYAPLGPGLSSAGAMAGILGTVAIGLVSPLFGGTPRLVSAPCAPAAAVLGTFAVAAIAPGPEAMSPAAVPFLLAVVALGAGGLQVLFGVLGGGRLIKFIPYPVVAGYLSGVGMIIVLGQLPKLIGLPKGVPLLSGLLAPSQWSWPALVVAGTAVAVMLLAPKITRKVPAPILALLGATVTFGALGFLVPELRVLDHNPYIIGPIRAEGAGGFLEGMAARLREAVALGPKRIAPFLTHAVTLAVLLSVDTLKTCVILDALTRSRHNSNRELIGQGLGNLAAGALGGMPGAGTMGATLVNLNSGGATRLSGVLVGAFALLVLLLLGPLVACELPELGA